MKVDENTALRAATAAGSMGETQGQLKAATTVANMVFAVRDGGPLTAYGEAYQQALKDVFDTLDPDRPAPQLPSEIWT